MADTKKIGAKIVLDGEQEFNQSLRNSKTALKEFDSELKLSQTQFKNNSKSLEALQKVQQAYVKQQEQLKKQEQAYVDQLAKASDVHKQAKSQHEETAKSVEELKKKLNEAEQEYGENSEEVEKLNAELKKSEDQYKKEENAISGLENKMSKWQTGLNSTRTELSNVEKSLDEVNQDIEHFGEEIDDAGDATKQANPEMEKLSVSMGKLVSADLIAEGIKKLAGAVVDLAKASFDVGSQFEASMSQVAATMGITTEEIANGSEEFVKLNDAAKKAGESTMFSASQSGEALNYLALAGYDADKAVETLPKVLDLAAAGGMELAYASDLVTDSMSALGMETSQLDNFIDQMAKTSQKSNTSVAQLGEATLVAAGAVAQVNMPLDVMNTALGVMANNGLKGAEGGTHLRNILLSLTAPTDKAAVAMEKLGLDIADSNGDMRDLQDIIEDLNYALGDMGDVEKSATLKQIFNKTDIGAVNALMKSMNGEWELLKENIDNCDGSAKNMAETMNDNLKGKITILQSALEGLGVATYEVFDQDAKDAVDGATDAVGRLTESVKSGDLNVSLTKMSDALDKLVDSTVDWTEKNLPKMIDGFTGLVESADILIPMLEGVVSGMIAFKAATTAVAVAQAIMKAYTTVTTLAAAAQEGFNLAVMANPIGLIAGGLTAAVVAARQLAIANEDLLSGITDLDKASRDMAQTSEAFNSSLERSAQTRAESASSLQAEQKVTEGLVDKLEKLQGEYAKGADNMTEMKSVVDQLNSALPELNLTIDEETGELNQSTEALRSNVEQMLQRQKVMAAEADLAQIAEEQYKAEKNLAELEKQRQEEVLALKSAEHDLTTIKEEQTNVFTRNAKELRDANQAIDNSKESLAILDEEIANSRDRINELSDEYATANDYINENSTSLDSDASSLAGVAEQAEMTAGQLTIMSDDFQELTNDLYESVQKTLESSNNLFSKTTEVQSQNIDDMRKNVEDHVKQIEDWRDSYTELAGRVDTESGAILEYLANMGVEGKGYIDELLTLDDAELNQFVEQMEEAMTLPSEVAFDVVDSYRTAVQESIDGMREVAADASGDGSELRNAEKEVAESLVEEIEEGLGTDGENVTKPVEEAMDGITSSIEDTVPKAEQDSKDLADAIETPIADNITYDDFYDYGEKAGEGLEDGLKSKIDSVRAAAQELANAANQGVSGPKGLDEHSPSKKMHEFGYLGGIGLKEGFEESLPEVVNAINKGMPNQNNIEVSSLQNISMDANTEGNGTLARLEGLLTEYLPVISKMKVVLDTGATVGALAPEMNQALGTMARREAYA